MFTLNLLRNFPIDALAPVLTLFGAQITTQSGQFFLSKSETRKNFNKLKQNELRFGDLHDNFFMRFQTVAHFVSSDAAFLRIIS